MDENTQAIADALPSYEIGGVIGKGGFGVVLSGRHRVLDRHVAIEQLPPSVASNSDVRDRFTAEGRVLAALDHPHVVRVYDYVESNGLCLLVMEMLPGGTVWSRFRKQGLDAPTAVAVALATAAGLTAAHSKGILHRDIKPENLMFSATGSLKVTDFGIAKVLGGNQTLATRAGEVIGTPSYIAPEQAKGDPVSPATDVYALATLLYELLSGRLPFPQSDPMQLLFAHAYGTPLPLREMAPSIPVGVAYVVMKGLSTDPALRYPTAEAFGIALGEATSAEWGPGWLTMQPVAVEGAETITSAAMSGSLLAAAPETVVVAGTAFSLAPETVFTGEVPRQVPPSASPAALPALRPPPPLPSVVVRPNVLEHVPGARLADVSVGDLVPVKDAVSAPSPWPPFFAVATLTAITAIAATLGLGSPVAESVPPAASIQIAGADPATVSPITLDLNAPVTVTSPELTPGTPATLSLRVLGLPIRSQTATVSLGDQGPSVVFPPVGGEFVAAGRLTADVEFTGPNSTAKRWAVPVRTTQTSYLTVASVGVGALLLFALAYVESFGRKLRRRRDRVIASAGTIASSALFGAGLTGAVWIAGGAEPTVTGLTVTSALAGATGAALAWALWRIGKKRAVAKAIARVQMTITLESR